MSLAHWLALLSDIDILMPPVEPASQDRPGSAVSLDEPVLIPSAPSILCAFDSGGLETDTVGTCCFLLDRPGTGNLNLDLIPPPIFDMRLSKWTCASPHPTVTASPYSLSYLV